MDQQNVSRKRKRHTPAEIIEKLRDADMLLARGMSVADIARKSRPDQVRSSHIDWTRFG